MRIVLGSFEYGNKPFGSNESQKTNGLSGVNRKLHIGELRNRKLKLNMKGRSTVYNRRRKEQQYGGSDSVKWITQTTNLSFLVHFGPIYARRGHMSVTKFP